MSDDYQFRSEFERLKRADVNQGKRIADLMSELASLRAENERLRAELAEANQSVDAVADTFTYVCDSGARYRDELIRIRPVYEAACAWRDVHGDDTHESNELIRAIDTARERSEGSGGEGE